LRVNSGIMLTVDL